MNKEARINRDQAELLETPLAIFPARGDADAMDGPLLIHGC